MAIGQGAHWAAQTGFGLPFAGETERWPGPSGLQLLMGWAGRPTGAHQASPPVGDPAGGLGCRRRETRRSYIGQRRPVGCPWVPTGFRATWAPMGSPFHKWVRAGQHFSQFQPGPTRPLRSRAASGWPMGGPSPPDSHPLIQLL
ncbi:hypothetical protein PCANC_04461 [Puccinia coronata f. sp. avenae]|uniref:Uncharacterized protein n=1 Tax=Puccinia coronata f. sp. avenae TaxID=200324 RepID=A0A2N5VUN3_9BASI|nr:hypothetical protein PCANC_04461 [Puccinia coronata f. sp. avenae]